VAETTLRVLRAASRARIPALIWGPPGGGKSEALEQLAAMEGVPCEVVIGSHSEPADFNGLPARSEDGDGQRVVERIPPNWAMRLKVAGKGMLFMDEMSTAAPSTQAAMLRTTKDKWVGDVKLPDDVFILGAANDADEAADGWDLAPPTANRFLHLSWKVSLEEWVTGMTIGFGTAMASYDLTVVDASGDRLREKRVLVASFIKTRPALLHAVPADPTQAGKGWPSPRTWDYLGRVLAYLRDEDTEAILLTASGLVGEPAALEFLTWVENYDLPDPKDVLAEPAVYDWSDTRTDRAFSVFAGVLSYVAAADTKKDKEDRFDRMWGVFEAAANANKADVAAAFVPTAMRIRPTGCTVPPQVASAFGQHLRRADLM
jgi:hypothetical protein